MCKLNLQVLETMEILICIKSFFFQPWTKDEGNYDIVQSL